MLSYARYFAHLSGAHGLTYSIYAEFGKYKLHKDSVLGDLGIFFSYLDFRLVSVDGHWGRNSSRKTRNDSLFHPDFQASFEQACWSRGMYYDLNVPWIQNRVELQKTLSFLSELDYNVVALAYTLAGKVPADVTPPIPDPLPFVIPPKLHVLRRVTVIFSDPSQNYRLSHLGSAYDILALRPTSEKALQQACHSGECDLISLDLSQRFPFYFKHKMLAPAVAKGIKFEICYAAGTAGESGEMARRNLIQNAIGLIRALRGRSIVVSSEAQRALACRAPADIVNLVAVWGLSQERGVEAVTREARAAVVQAGMRKTSFRGTVNVVYGGEKPKIKRSATINPKGGDTAGEDNGNKKRKPVEKTEEEKPISKREAKRRAKKARLEAYVKPPDQDE